MKKLSAALQKIFTRVHNQLLVRSMSSPKSSREKLKSNQKLFIAILVFGLIAFIWERNKVTTPLAANETRKSVDTFIPLGFVLVPIQLSNAEALDSMISATGVVDLFIPDMKKPGHNKKIAEHIKILRAPLNPNQFAVLVPEKNSGQLVHYEGAYFAVVQNPKALGTQIETKPIRKLPSRLTMEDVREFK